ncbi:hypothetical protein L596_012782 [Steinernema carpocapsae]|uniref:Uncharacterized protein n=1 Tax=Steinernema carpocapsae TaxID=34508 RepID=A0A4U5NY94_STECR|nr:hypothetical protein L596_012782 [Steinernema carpocapsae]
MVNLLPVSVASHQLLAVPPDAFGSDPEPRGPHPRGRSRSALLRPRSGLHARRSWPLRRQHGPSSDSSRSSSGGQLQSVSENLWLSGSNLFRLNKDI